MYKTVLISLVCIALACQSACTKDKTPEPPPCSQADTVNTYTKSVKVILDGYCASSGCHDQDGTAGVRLNNYENAVSAARNEDKFYCVIDGSCGPQMPPGPQPLADSLLSRITAWRDNCYPQ